MNKKNKLITKPENKFDVFLIQQAILIRALASIFGLWKIWVPIVSITVIIVFWILITKF